MLQLGHASIEKIKRKKWEGRKKNKLVWKSDQEGKIKLNKFYSKKVS